jgi:hypothetical protein
MPDYPAFIFFSSPKYVKHPFFLGTDLFNKAILRAIASVQEYNQ